MGASCGFGDACQEMDLVIVAWPGAHEMPLDARRHSACNLDGTLAEIVCIVF